MDGRGGDTTGPLRVVGCFASSRRGGSRRLAIVCLTAALVATACAGDDPSEPAADADPTPSTSAPEVAVEPEPPVEADEPEPTPESTVDDGFDLPTEVGQYPPAPLATRDSSAIVETGNSVIVWGGHLEGPNIGDPDLGWPSFVDGAVLDIATGRWRTMADAPLEDSRRVPVAAAVDHRVVIGRDRSIALYDPLTDRWEELPDLDFGASEVFALGEDTVAAVGWPDRIALLDLDEPEPTWVPAALTDAGSHVAWTTDGERLIASVTTREGQRLEALEPGETSASILGFSEEVQLFGSFQDVTVAGDRIVLVHEGANIWSFVEPTGTWEDTGLALFGPAWEVPPVIDATADGRVFIRKAPTLFELSGLTEDPQLTAIELPTGLFGRSGFGTDRWWSFGYFVSEARNELASFDVPAPVEPEAVDEE